MAQNRMHSISLYSGYIGLALVLIAGGFGLFAQGQLPTPLFAALVGGLALVVFSFFTSGAISGRQMKYGSNMAVMVALFAAILGFGNYLASRYPQRLDMTKQGLFTMSEQTIKILENLKEPVKAVAFMSPRETEEYGSVQELLKNYERFANGKFILEIVDPYVDRVRAMDLKVQQMGTVVFIAGEEKPENQNRYSVTKTDYVEFDYSGAPQGQAPVSQFKGEQAFTSAILKVTGGEKKKVYFLAGHGEIQTDSQEERGLSLLKDALEGEGFVTESLHLAKTQQVPEDASLLVVAAPKTPLLSTESQIIANYVKGGGRALVMPGLFGSPSLNEITQEFGLAVGEDVIIDPASRDMLSPEVTVATGYPYHEITETMQKMQAYTFFPAARTLTITPKQPWTAGKLVETTQHAWGESTPRGSVRPDPGVDKMGVLTIAAVVDGVATDVPLEVKVQDTMPRDFGFGQIEVPPTQPPASPASPDQPPASTEQQPPVETQPAEAPAEATPAASSPEPASATTPGGGQGGGPDAQEPPAAASPAAEPQAETKPAEQPPASTEAPKTRKWSEQGKMAVISTAEAASNFYFQQGGNRDLLMNTVAWLVGKKELISIRAKDTTLPPLSMTADEVISVFWITVVIVPLAILGLGVWVWYKRR